MASHKAKPYQNKLKGAYHPDTLKKAVYDVINGILTVQEASKKYGIKIRTLQHHVK